MDVIPDPSEGQSQNACSIVRVLVQSLSLAIIALALLLGADTALFRTSGVDGTPAFAGDHKHARPLGFDDAPLELAHVLCQPAPVPTVAYMFSGVPRTFASPKVHLSFMRNVVHSFGARPVFFFYFKTTKFNYDDDYVMNGAPDEDRLTNASREAIEHVLERFNPRVVVWEEDFDIRELFHQCGSKAPHWRVVSQMYALQQALSLVHAYERRNMLKFDWVMRIRPDLVWHYGIKPYCGFNRNILYDPNTFGDGTFVPYGDWFVLVRGDLSSELFGLMDRFGKECSFPDVFHELQKNGRISESNRISGSNFMPGYVLRHCNFGNLQEFCSYMTDKRYFANGADECGTLLHNC